MVNLQLRCDKQLFGGDLDRSSRARNHWNCGRQELCRAKREPKFHVAKVAALQGHTLNRSYVVQCFGCIKTVS